MLIFILGIICGFVVSYCLYSLDSKNKKSSMPAQTASSSVHSTALDNNFSASYKLNKNELPQGKYIIGTDIPVGVYDFFVIFGSGGKFDIAVFDDNNKIIENTWAFYWIGLEKDYEKKQLIHIDCKAGYIISITGNVVVRIAKSQPITLDL